MKRVTVTTNAITIIKAFALKHQLEAEIRELNRRQVDEIEVDCHGWKSRKATNNKEYKKVR